MSIETMTKLASTTVGVGGSASVVFSNIPQNYTDLCIKISCQTNRSADEGGLSVQLNSATTGQTYRVLAGLGSNGTNSVDTAYEPLWVCRIQGGTAGTNVFSNTDLYIPNYAGNKPKVILADSATEKNASIAYITLSSVVQANSSPVTSLTLSGLGGTLQQHSTFTVYGIKNVRQTVGNSIKATGGNIIFDGTYVTHTFNSTGAFTPTQPLVADVLTIAGGGCGGGGNGGGGGAGGLVYSPLQTLATSSYAITIGAGGSGGLTNNRGPAGSNSQFGALTAAIGGGGGGGFDTNSTGGNGGSGGGGGSYSSTGGSLAGGTGSQGNNGGTGFNPGGYPYHGGGGGGAGAAGANATSLVCGNGGIGALYFGSYYAGGGGGGGDLGSGTTTFGTGGNGGGGVGGSPQGSASNGTINTGGGGGGEGGGGGGANGGSGVVIIRYKG